MELKRKIGSVKQRIALGIVCVLIFAYTIYHLSGARVVLVIPT